MFQIFIIILEFLTFVTTAIFGVYILARAPRENINRVFSVIMMGISGWALTIVLLLTETGPIDLPGRLAFSFASVFMAALGAFIVVFPKPARGSNLMLLFFLAVGIIFGIIPLLPSFVANIQIVDGHIVGDLSPMLFPLWSLSYVVNLLLNLVFLGLRTLLAKGVARARLFQLLFGFFLFLCLHITTNVLLPLLRQDFRWNNLGPAFILLLLPFMVTAITRYRLLDIRFIVSKSIVFTGVSIIVLWVAFSITFIFARFVSPIWSYFIASLIIACILHPLSHALERGLNWLFVRGGYDQDKVHNKILSIVRTQINLEVMMREITTALREAFRVSNVAMIAFSPRGTMTQGAIREGFDESVFEIVAPIYAHFKNHREEIWETEELSWRLEYEHQSRTNKIEDGRIRNALEKHGVSIVVPVVMEGRLTALIIFGARKFDRVLSSKDVWFLNLVRQGMAPAIANASRFAEMQELYAKLKETDSLKSQFIDTISHQFRTPLSSIRWNIETMMDKGKALGEESKGILREVELNSRFLVRTLNIFVDVIQYESGTALVEKLPIETTKLEEVFGKYHAQAKTKGIHWTQRIENGVFIGDLKELRKAVKEVLRNALEYTQAGGSIAARVVPVDGKIKIEVTDSGIGIAAKDQRRLFNKFYRSRAAVLVHPDGSGLGLYLAKLIINKLGGTIEVESENGKGTTVRIYLTAQKSLASSTEPVAAKPKAKKKRV